MMNAVARDMREMVQEQFEFRELLNQLVRRDLLIRYKQSVMGFAWAVFMPLVNTALFSLVFIKITTIQVDVPYPLFAYCGFMFWNLTASALRFAVAALTSNATLVTKVYCPREVFVFSSVIVAVIDSAVGSAILIALMVYYGVGVGPAVLFLPVVLGVQILLTTGIGLVLAMANVYYRDVKYIFDVAITVMMFGTAVMYPLDQVQGLTGRVLRLNPMSTILEAYRDVLFRGRLPESESFAVAAIVSLACFVLGWLWFHRAEAWAAENI